MYNMILLNYKGYHGSIEYSSEDKFLYGRVLGLKNTFISYEGKNELIQAEWNKVLQNSMKISFKR